ncbi:hypothetical protein AGLY_008762 [Aphis glycines]|uniref:Uncharacterized protein n=1 Tax=Aphis glycines TaxID=307491 RepID=A0A6G0TJG7_APHGL|nr:hypothetical protein AGLY_008762 [Aphis glycines]
MTAHFELTLKVLTLSYKLIVSILSAVSSTKLRHANNNNIFLISRKFSTHRLSIVYYWSSEQQNYKCFWVSCLSQYNKTDLKRPIYSTYEILFNPLMYRLKADQTTIYREDSDKGQVTLLIFNAKRKCTHWYKSVKIELAFSTGNEVHGVKDVLLGTEFKILNSLFMFGLNAQIVYKERQMHATHITIVDNAGPERFKGRLPNTRQHYNLKKCIYG